MKKYLVTGVAGFIGSHLSEKLLLMGASVIGIDNFDSFYEKEIKLKNLEELIQNPNFTFYESDIRDLESMLRISSNHQIDTFIHLAAKAGVLPSLKDPASYIDFNITGTNNVLEMIRIQKHKKNLVFASSSSVYGNNIKIPFSENDIVDYPISPYAFTKKACELMNYSYHHLYDINILNLRLFTVYGPRQRPDLAIRKFTSLIMNDKSVTIYGDGETSRDYTFIEDTISGFISSINYLENHENVYEIINLGNHTPIKLSHLVETLYSVLGKKKNIIYSAKQQGDVEITYADITKAKELLNYNPNTSLEEGLSKFYNWYTNHTK